MNYERIVQCILDLGEAMLRSGAENFRLDDSLYRMCRSYGFVRSDVFVIPSNIQITVETPEGQIITQIRHIENTSANMDRLDYLNNLCRYVCANKPDVEEFKEKFQEVMNRKQQSLAVDYLAGILSGVGFSVFFGANFMDAINALLVSIMFVTVGKWLAKRESNLLIYNVIMAFLSGVMIIGLYKIGIGEHTEYIMIGIIMLLISALGVTTGIRELIQRDFISGSINIMNSILGATGIAFGIALALMIFDMVSMSGDRLANNQMVQLISCTVGCIGFACLFKVRGKQIFYSGIGAFFTYLIYLGVYRINQSNFFATMIAAVFVAFFAFIMSRICKAPSTVFLTSSVFPIIPGSNLYYMMYGFVSKDRAMVLEETIILLGTCLGIALGFLIVDVLSRTIMSLLKHEYHISKSSNRR